MKPHNLVVVHRCSEQVRTLANEALHAKAQYDKHMRIAQTHLDDFIRKRDRALSLAKQEYPPLADDNDPSVFVPKSGTVVMPVVNKTSSIIIAPVH